MAKDPAFLFYSQDFFTGSAVLSFEDKGKYIHLLCLMHQQGRMDEETIRFTVGSVSVKLKSKFKIDENGFWYNERLEKESAKRNKFTKSRVDNGLKGGRPKKKITDRLSVGLANHNHMGNENDNSINTVTNNKIEGEKKTFNTKPLATDFNGLPENYMQKSIEFVKITKQADITKDMVTTLWEVFKVQKLTGHEYHANEGKVYSYFLDWIKFQKFDTLKKELTPPIKKENQVDFEKYKKKQ